MLQAVAVPIHYDGRVIGSTSTLVDCWYNQLMEDLVGNDGATILAHECERTSADWLHKQRSTIPSPSLSRRTRSIRTTRTASPASKRDCRACSSLERSVHRCIGVRPVLAVSHSHSHAQKPSADLRPNPRVPASRGAIVLARQHNAVHIWSTRFSPVSEDDPADEVVDAEVRLLLLEGTLMPQDQKTRQGRAGRKPNALVPVTRKPQTDPTKRAEVRSDYRSHRPPSDPNKPIRPASAYLSYQNEIRAAVKANNPDLPPTEINKRIGEMWRALPAEEQEVRTQLSRVVHFVLTTLTRRRANLARKSSWRSGRRRCVCGNRRRRPRRTSRVPCQPLRLAIRTPSALAQRTTRLRLTPRRSRQRRGRGYTGAQVSLPDAFSISCAPADDVHPYPRCSSQSLAQPPLYGFIRRPVEGYHAEVSLRVPSCAVMVEDSQRVPSQGRYTRPRQGGLVAQHGELLAACAGRSILTCVLPGR